MATKLPSDRERRSALMGPENRGTGFRTFFAPLARLEREAGSARPGSALPKTPWVGPIRSPFPRTAWRTLGAVGPPQCAQAAQRGGGEEWQAHPAEAQGRLPGQQWSLGGRARK